MFTIKDNAITPHRGSLEKALGLLPEAHITAQKVGVSHLHRAVTAAAEQAGLPSSPITVGWDHGQAYLGIAQGEEGDRLADREYGTPEEDPSPVLRVAHRKAWDTANGHYAQVLRREVGL